MIPENKCEILIFDLGNMISKILFFKKGFIYLRYVNTLSLSQTHQKRASDPITDGCEPPCSCWELNSGPLEEQSVLLTAEPSLQLPITPVLIALCSHLEGLRFPHCIWQDAICIHYLSSYWDKTLDQNILGKERFIWAHSSKESWGKGIAAGAWDSWSHSVHRKRRAGSYPVQVPSLWDGTVHS